MQERASPAGVREHGACRSAPPLQVSGSTESAGARLPCRCPGAGSTECAGVRGGGHRGESTEQGFPGAAAAQPRAPVTSPPPSFLSLRPFPGWPLPGCTRASVARSAFSRLPSPASAPVVRLRPLPSVSVAASRPPSNNSISSFGPPAPSVSPSFKLTAVRQPLTVVRHCSAPSVSSSFMLGAVRQPLSAVRHCSVPSVTARRPPSLLGNLRQLFVRARRCPAAPQGGPSLLGVLRQPFIQAQCCPSPLTAVCPCPAPSVRAWPLGTICQPFVRARRCPSDSRCCPSLLGTLRRGSALFVPAQHPPLALRSGSAPSVRLSVLSVTARHSPSGLGPSARCNSRSSRLGAVRHHPSAVRVGSAPRPSIQARRCPSPPQCCPSLFDTLRLGSAPRHPPLAFRSGPALSVRLSVLSVTARHSPSGLGPSARCNSRSSRLGAVRHHPSAVRVGSAPRPSIQARRCPSPPQCCPSLFDTLRLGSAPRHPPLAFRSGPALSVRLSVLSVTARHSPSGLGPSARCNSRSSRLGAVRHHPSAVRVSSAPRPFVQARRRPSAPQCCSSVLGILRPGSAPRRAITVVPQDLAPSIVIRQQFV
uniref:BCL-6 corepressor-like protein 1 isoform X2 n=1 Tax=Halichoerus grypus TaxID=9711 RepID=UPI0016595D9A|nr:BCL-6 corepressor-like protein 1 isoform X2 [Halichoerus grypus]XP_035935794.1 BCL-6 corepressor-like protein 1 isoform X2 [Halichoerus grypus]XP_035935795.1 BCL-6 corepressor-like protein 1 isoform X2 [Halichoerus grypus]